MDKIRRRRKNMMDKAREIALMVLYNIDKKDAYSNLALDEALKQAKSDKKEIQSRDIGFISEIVYGTVSWKLTIDEIIKKHSNIRIKKISPWILNILRMSIYQIIFLDKVPKSAAVNEGVNLAKRYGHRASSNFVNAILRKVEKKDYEDFFSIESDMDRISKTTSMPIWIVEELAKQNEIKKVEEICEASNLKPKLYIRVNYLKTDRQTLKKELEKQSIKVTEVENEKFLIVEGAKNIEKLKSFQEGWFSIQDEAAGLIPEQLKPQSNQKVLDACSSPGGKTTYMAELMKNQGEIKAWDIHEHRVKLVDKAANRLGITIIQTEEKDASIYDPQYYEYFDKVLLDVPCLGIGVIKRKPDIKWKKKKEDIEKITTIQKAILENCAKYLKDKGELVYSTCSILQEENDKIIQDFVKNNKDFKIVENLQIYQNEKTDGFFICKMQKNKT